MLLRIPYEEAPDFANDGNRQIIALEEWLAKRGLSIITATKLPLEYTGPEIELLVSRNNHCVIFTNSEIIDPHEPPLYIDDTRTPDRVILIVRAPYK